MFRELHRRLSTATGDVKHSSGAGSVLEIAVLQDMLVEAVRVGRPEEGEYVKSVAIIRLIGWTHMYMIHHTQCKYSLLFQTGVVGWHVHCAMNMSKLKMESTDR